MHRSSIGRLFLENACWKSISIFSAIEKKIIQGVWYCNEKAFWKKWMKCNVYEQKFYSNLSTIYTNHCVRVTIIFNLSRQGFSSEQISTVSRHKNVNSVQRYVRSLRDCEKRNISDGLRNLLIQKKKSSSQKIIKPVTKTSPVLHLPQSAIQILQSTLMVLSIIVYLECRVGIKTKEIE